MKTVVDEYGKWEVQDDVGSISRRMIEPTQKWIDENPPTPPQS